MFVRRIGPFIEPTKNGKLSRTITYGRQGRFGITVDEVRDESGKIVEKRFVKWDDVVQRIFFKKRKADGKGFEWESK